MATAKLDAESPVTDKRVIDTAGRVEIDRARARILELERQLAAYAAVPFLTKALKWAIGISVTLLAIAACAAAAHRLLVWGWP